VNRHVRWQFLVGFLGLLPNVGCIPLSGSTLPALPVHSDPASVSKAAPLPAHKSAEICMNLAESLEKSDHPGEAIAQYEKARQDNPGLRVERKLGVLYDQVGDTRKAMAEFDKALKQTPNDPNLLNNIGFCFYNQRKFDEAEAYLSRAVALEPKHAHATVNLALTLAQQGKYEDSVKLYTKVVSEAEAYSNVAFVLTTQGKKEEAKRMYHQALQCESGLAIAQLALDRLENPGKAAAANKKPAAEQVARRAPERERPPEVAAPPAEPLPDQSDVIVDPFSRRKGAAQ
jgi:tetratricopeptide (TPR) repeat protein